MKAVVLEAFGDSTHFKLKEVPIPQPVLGEVRIRIRASGFNPVDYKTRMGSYGGSAPVILGTDCSGTIDALGPEVSNFALGDEVYAMPFGQCSNGSYAEYLCIPVEFVWKKPKNISFEQAAAIPLAAMTAYRAMIASGAIKKGDAIFIAGAGGGVGTLAIELARSIGVGAIFTLAGSEESAHFLEKQMGLKRENILLYRGLIVEEMVEKLVQMHGGRLFDASFDFVGGEMKRLCLQVARHSGHVATIVPENASFSLPVWERGASLLFGKNLSLHCVFVGSESFTAPRRDWAIYQAHLRQISHLIEQGSVRSPAIKVVGGLSAETVREAHRLLEEGKVKGKLIMQIAQS